MQSYSRGEKYIYIGCCAGKDDAHDAHADADMGIQDEDSEDESGDEEEDYMEEDDNFEKDNDEEQELNPQISHLHHTGPK